MLLSLRGLSVSNKRQKGARSEWEGIWGATGGIKGGESVIRIYYGRKKSIFNQREKKYRKHTDTDTNTKKLHENTKVETIIYKQKTCMQD